MAETIFTEPNALAFPHAGAGLASGLAIRVHLAALAMQGLLAKHGAASCREDGVYLRQRPDAEACRGEEDVHGQKRRKYYADLVADNRASLAQEAVRMADALIVALGEGRV